MTATPEPTLHLLDPATLLVDRNIRRAQLDRDFLASIRDHGVIEPIVAVRTEDGGIRVRHGHRRTLAAIETATAPVPVVIVGAEDDDEADRIAKQWHENKHRAALSNVEEVTAVDQLALLGLSAAAIAKRLRAPRKHVDNALAVRGSELARKATARYEFLTLDQAARIAEFEDDVDTVKALVLAAKDGEVQFGRAVAAAAEARATATATAELAAALTEEGVTVVGAVPRNPRLDELTDADGTVLDAHQNCPGHAAYITQDWRRTVRPDEQDQASTTNTEHALEGGDEGNNDEDDGGEDDEDGWVLVPTAVYVCTQADANGHQARWGNRTSTGCPSNPDADATAKAAETDRRRVTLANNRAWRASEPIRRDWLRALANRKTAPKGGAGFITTALTRDGEILTKAMQRAVPHICELLGLSSREEVESLASSATDARAAHIALMTVLAAYEDNTRVDSWRTPGREDRRYFPWLAANGYPLSDIETLVTNAE